MFPPFSYMCVHNVWGSIVTRFISVRRAMALCFFPIFGVSSQRAQTSVANGLVKGSTARVAGLLGASGLVPISTSRYCLVTLLRVAGLDRVCRGLIRASSTGSQDLLSVCRGPTFVKGLPKVTIYVTRQGDYRAGLPIDRVDATMTSHYSDEGILRVDRVALGFRGQLGLCGVPLRLEEEVGSVGYSSNTSGVRVYFQRACSTHAIEAIVREGFRSYLFCTS